MSSGSYRRMIGGVTVAVDPVGCSLDSANDPDYHDFTCPPEGPRADLKFTVHCGGSRPLPPGPPLFQTAAWAIWPRPDGGFVISLLRASVTDRPTIESDRESRLVCYHEVNSHVPLVNGERRIGDVFRLPLDQLFLVQHLAFRQGAIVHSTGFAFGDAGIVFPGASGAGKSTLTGLLTAAFPASHALSDERIIVRAREGGFDAWGTPWPGTARVARNERAPLRALMFLEQHAVHGIRSITPKEAVRRLFAVVACPLYDPVRSVLVLETVERLVASVPSYVLRFARDPGVARVLEDFLHRELGVAVA